MIHHITAVVFAGGKSSRMGSNKALLPYNGKNLIDAPIELLSGLFRRVVLSVRDAEPYHNYSLTKIVDSTREIGPMGGIASVLRNGYGKIFCVACDMPYLNLPLIEYMCNYADRDAVIPVWEGRLESLHAIYSVAVLSAMERCISEKRYRISDALDKADVRYIKEDEVRQFDPEGKCFRNVNTPFDYEKLRDV